MKYEYALPLILFCILAIRFVWRVYFKSDWHLYWMKWHIDQEYKCGNTKKARHHNRRASYHIDNL